MSDSDLDRVFQTLARSALQTHAHEAKQGDSPTSARWLAGVMADHLAGKTPDALVPVIEAYMPVFVGALRAIAAGESADTALGLKVGGGKRERKVDARNKRLRNFAVARAVEALRTERIQPTRNPTSEPVSGCDIVAARFGLSYENVQKIYFDLLPAIRDETKESIPL